MKKETILLPSKNKRKAYICAELSDVSFSKNVAEGVNRVIEEFRGEVTESSVLFETVTIIAAFPHRQLKTLEESVTKALAGLPVREVVVWATDPFKLRRNRAA